MQIIKKNLILYVSVFVLLLGANIFTFHNHSFYNNPIVRIDSADTAPSNSASKSSNSEESLYDQVLEGRIMNSVYKGQTIILKNSFFSSELYQDSFSKGDEVFITLNSQGSTSLSGTITGLKRDKYVVLLLSALLMLLVFLEKRKGLLTMISLFLNITVFYSLLTWYQDGTDILTVCILASLFFTLFSLTFLNGFSRKTLAAVLSTILSVTTTMAIFMVVMNNSREIDFAYMEYLIMPGDARAIFLSGILIGGLGSIMDIAITMSSAINEIQRKNPSVTVKALFSSGRTIGDDIMGTMINVLLFTYVCGGIPMTILLLKNDIPPANIISVYMPYEIYRFLIGSIGILLAIPVSLVISILFTKGGKHLCFWH
ncbi:YibE/F family protein [Anaerobium acetethylicum]|uniref:Uncharacterized membrane protein n=1 Tax=Anaerobium acetethylicum TaxID=1619234 RepID=A0A1D3TVY4_9FIRM|nr:YibE/F family protein [Anaerobium acetethylicum]SCP98347.1 Uncharacterized membrane protein [Anaerobium acetethylicum]